MGPSYGTVDEKAQLEQDDRELEQPASHRAGKRRSWIGPRVALAVGAALMLRVLLLSAVNLSAPSTREELAKKNKEWTGWSSCHAKKKKKHFAPSGWRALFKKKKKKAKDPYLCGVLTVPMDWENTTDTRKVHVAITKLLASAPKAEQLGGIFVNPGGPGGSGTEAAYSLGPQFMELTGGAYDIIGFDPRGVNQTLPTTLCFDDPLEAYLFDLPQPGLFDLPSSNFDTPDVRADIARQLEQMEATYTGHGRRCAKRTGPVGDELAFFGTKYVIRDIERMAEVLLPPGDKINYMGISYGTVVGQYLLRLVEPSKLGKVLIDGVINVNDWAKYAHEWSIDTLVDAGSIVEFFAETCVSVGPDVCELAKLGSANRILSAFDELIDRTYKTPVPLPELDALPGLTANSRHIRTQLLRHVHNTKVWSDWDRIFADAILRDNLTTLVEQSLPVYNPKEGVDGIMNYYHSLRAVRCADARPYNVSEPGGEPPTTADRVELLVNGLTKYSSRIGESFFWQSLCTAWPTTSKSWANVTDWSLPAHALETPALILSNRLDAVTPLVNANNALTNLGMNGRLVWQNGTGHCALLTKSACTEKIVQDYFVRGVVQNDTRTFCGVDEYAFENTTATTIPLPLPLR